MMDSKSRVTCSVGESEESKHISIKDRTNTWKEEKNTKTWDLFFNCCSNFPIHYRIVMILSRFLYDDGKKKHAISLKFMF